jgi:hypothetical protein
VKLTGNDSCAPTSSLVDMLMTGRELWDCGFLNTMESKLNEQSKYEGLINLDLIGKLTRFKSGK